MSITIFETGLDSAGAADDMWFDQGIESRPRQMQFAPAHSAIAMLPEATSIGRNEFFRALFYRR